MIVWRKVRENNPIYHTSDGMLLYFHSSQTTGHIPIPFILNTGAPGFIYLCSAAVHHLERLDAIKETTGVYPYQLLGTFGPGSKSVHHPYIDVMPRIYEERAPDDVRINLLGIKAMKHFGLFFKN